MVKSNSTKGVEFPEHTFRRFAEEDRGFTTPCWIWTGSARQGANVREGGPYGRIHVGGRYYTAHRAFYARFVSDIPEGFVVHHECEQKLCVNPDHLTVVTQSENMRRRYDVRIPCPHCNGFGWSKVK